MKRKRKGTLKSLIIIFILFTAARIKANQQDSVYLFAYSVNDGKSGLTLAWSLEEKNWHPIGPEHCFLFSDFGSWGSQKRMYAPFLIQDKGGMWHCFWTLNDEVGQLAHAASTNLVQWKRQSYPVVMPGGNIIDPEVDASGDSWMVTWLSRTAGKEKVYQSNTTDFKSYSVAVEIAKVNRKHYREEVEINGDKHRGMIVKVPWELVEGLIKHEEWARFHEMERAETMQQDLLRFAHLGNLDARISPRLDETKQISDMLIGIFFEDISYAADGGLYAELIQNRDFEYEPGDRDFLDSTWNHTKAWTIAGPAIFNIDTVQPIHPHNRHYASIDILGDHVSLTNGGWDGIPVVKGESYEFSVFARVPAGVQGGMEVIVRTEEGVVSGSTFIELEAGAWTRYDATIDMKQTGDSSVLELRPEFGGKVELDMVSLFPIHTFKNRKNGLRADLAQAIADLQPKFIRFPGGCVAHGDGLDNMYRWENTIGPLETRVPQRNIWGYHQSAGLGYFEYFQFCEDIGAEPIPVVPAGVPCQNSHTGGHGQQCGIPWEEMDAYVQSVLNLIEWANGDTASEWGKKRAGAGHPEPFNLKYIGVGNEDLITDVFEERFTMIYEAIRKNYPEITVIGTVGPFSSGTDYLEGWDLARRLEIPMVDEHYYQTPGWFINNQDYYDKYDRNGPKVYLGEYASHVSGRKTNMETALSEALYLTSIERNGDVVRMTSYAPLLAKEGYTNWNPDLIYFNNTEVKPTVDYFVQQLYGKHSGTRYIPVRIELTAKEEKVRERFGVSLVEDQESGDLILKLVNLLPVDIRTEIDLDPFTVSNAGKLIVMQGDPEDQKVTPIEHKINIAREFAHVIPACSFHVIRIEKL
jgi:alpha-L-arabinofuranosidase